VHLASGVRGGWKGTEIFTQENVFDSFESLSEADQKRLHSLSSDERARTLNWLSAECARRISLTADQFCTSYLVSYPRSGNHAVRYAIERLAARPTLGANDYEGYSVPRGMLDLPLFLRDPTIQISDLRPILVKRHRLRNVSGVKKLIYLHRDPVEAILSHTRGTKDDLRSEVQMWKSLRSRFEMHPIHERLLIQYDEINVSDWIFQAVSFLQIKVTEDRISEAMHGLHSARRVLRRPPQTLNENSWANRFPELAQKIRGLLVETLEGIEEDAIQ